MAVSLTRPGSPYGVPLALAALAARRESRQPQRRGIAPARTATATVTMTVPPAARRPPGANY